MITKIKFNDFVSDTSRIVNDNIVTYQRIWNGITVPDVEDIPEGFEMEIHESGGNLPPHCVVFFRKTMTEDELSTVLGVRT